VITIGQLARYVGVSTKTIRVYHDKGLLPEPPRDESGYRRYTAQDLVELVKIRTLAEAGLPLAQIARISAGSPAELRAAAAAAETDLAARIEQLTATLSRLRDLAAGNSPFLPPDVEQHLRGLRDLGFSDRRVALETDLWILTFATDPDTARRYFTDQAQAQDDPELRGLYLEYDRAYDLDPGDPALTDLAARIVTAALDRYPTDDPAGDLDESPLPQLVQASINESSPAWERLDTLIREGLSRRAPMAGSNVSVRRDGGPRE
jgi:DNA-binding transcriptional MerR regulator